MTERDIDVRLTTRLASTVGARWRPVSPAPEAVVVLIDARNVLRSQWPNIPEDELVELACQWAQRKGVRALVVFDGRAPASVNDECLVVGTGSESADEWLARRAEELRADGTRFWLVTSDRALRDVAGRGAERTIGGGSFANELRPGPPGQPSKRVDRSIQTEPRAKPTPPDGGTASGAAR
jgi:predicted RNA-binding protein with PIN domain